MAVVGTLIAVAIACAQVDQTFVICEQGAPRPPVIVLSADAGPAEELAASEMARYVGLMAAVDLQIVRGNDPPDHAIVIRCVAAPQLGDEGYSISIRDGRLYIEGARGRSVLYAVYDVLERLGCRWLAPGFDCYAQPVPKASPAGGENELVPRTRPLIVTLERPVIEKPKFKYRKIYVEEGLSHTRENLLQLIEWMPKARYNTLVVPTDYQGHGRVKWDNWRDALIPELRRRDLIIEVGGHGYQNFLNSGMENGKLFEKHPEWFGMDSQGNRHAEPEWVFCTSNRAAVEYLSRNVVSYLRSHPEIDIFDFWPPDGAKWCECAECAKLGKPSDRQALLIREVEETVRKEGIPTRFECIAYSVYTSPPEHVEMPDSVLVDFCPINQCFEHQIYESKCARNAMYASAIREWKLRFRGEVSLYSYYRKYAWRSLPNIIPNYIQKDLQWYARMGVAGVSTYAEPGDWRTYELNHYVLGRLAWNPDADVGKLVREFAYARFGRSGDAAIGVYRALEETVRKVSSIPNITPKSPSEIEQASRKLRSALEGFLKQAETGAATQALQASVEYALRDFALQKSAIENKSVRERRAMVEELARFISSFRGRGIFLENRLGLESLLKAYKAH